MNRVDAILKNPNDHSLVVEACQYSLEECETLRKTLLPENERGSRLMDWAIKIPYLSDTVNSKWSEMKAIEQHMETLISVATQKARKKYIENYNRELTGYQVNDYAKADPAVIELCQLQVRVTLAVNKWEALSKGFAQFSYQIRYIMESRKNGLDEMSI